MENNPKKYNSRRRYGAIFGPLLLIALGLLLLLDTLGLLGRSAWDIIINLWPLLFIALGLDALFRKKEIFGPVFWFGLGCVFLLTNFGILDWEAWNAIFRLWPLLLVTAGLEILLGKRSFWLSLSTTVVVLGILAIALGLTNIGLPAQTTIETNIEVPLGSAEQADVSITMGVGDLNLFSLIDASKLVAGRISTDGANVQSKTTMRGNTVVYSLDQPNPTTVAFDNSWQWNLGLTQFIPIKLHSSLGAGAMSLTLDDIILEGLSIGIGVGEVDMTLPDGSYNAEISQAVGQIIVEIPKDVPIRFEINRAVSGLSLPSDFVKHNDYFYTPGTLGTDEYMIIEIKQAVGNIILRYK